MHYTGTDWRTMQPWILLTNYHRYVDQFVRWALEQLQARTAVEQLVLPGGVDHRARARRGSDRGAVAAAPGTASRCRPIISCAPDGRGVTLVNIGVGPSNAKNITDHLAVLRPHCWLMVGHCGGLRQSQMIGDYVLAHGYLRRDRILDDARAAGDADPGAGRSAGGAAGGGGQGHRRSGRSAEAAAAHRHGRHQRRPQLGTALDAGAPAHQPLPRHRRRHGSGTIAAQGFRLRVPYGTLLCVSDKPLHGEIKLPGAANAFYERAVGEHLQIGLAAIDLLRSQRASLHSRKLRSFDEPPFR